MRKRNEHGYVMVGVLFILALGLALSASMLGLSASGTKTRAVVKAHADYQYECEQTLNKTVAWLQDNSQNIVSAFRSSEFSSHFNLGSPQSGSNEGEFFEVPTMVKMAGTSNSVMLSNNSYFGSPAFPTTTNLSTGTPFDAVTAFQNADLGSANARVIMMWARETEGNYEPVFRVDAVTGNNPDRGAHMFTYVYSQLLSEGGGAGAGGGTGIGFYTENGPFETKTGNNTCFSYAWTHNGTSWSKGAPRSNCVIASKDQIILESKINGDVLTTLSEGVHIDPPSGEVSGTICEESGCHSHSLAAFPDWTTTCGGSSQGSLVLTSNTTLTSGPALNQQCWEVIQIEPNVRLTLTDKVNPYRFKTLNFRNNSNSKLLFPAMVPGEKVTIYVDNFAGGQLNGNQYVNTNNAPQNVEINITSAANFLLNGTADFHGHFIAPLSFITLNGNFNFHGAIQASQVYVSGNARFNYDEGLAIAVATTPQISDLAFTAKKASQRYR